MKKIISVVGARPQFIKHTPVQLELQKHFDAITIHTGQHYDADMSDIFFNELKIPKPEYHLTLKGKLHGEQTAEMMVEIEKISLQEQPAAILVYGDTNSTLAAALVAAKLNIPVIHVEAGLRSFNKEMPEEVNRILVDHVSKILFCPSAIAVQHLKNEGVTTNVYLCGDVMKDMLQLATPFLRDLMGDEKYYFATIHRPYNTDSRERMLEILNRFQQLSAKVVFPIHPRTSNLLQKYNIDRSDYDNIIMIPPVGYFDSLSYQKNALAVLTDSGGMQKEAYWLGKKCVTVRKETEWVETLEGGWNTLCFDQLDNIQQIIDAPAGEYNELLYGEDLVAKRIVANIIENLGE